MQKIKNPLAELISDEIYILLEKRGLIDQKSVRNFQIKKKFHELRRKNKMRASEAIEKLREEYPYLQFDSIRKIVYHKFE